MSSSKIEWKNAPDLYNDYCYLEECPLAMRRILVKYKWFFDDDYFYWLARTRGFKNTYQRKVKRRPLYWYPQKATPSEKSGHGLTFQQRTKRCLT